MKNFFLFFLFGSLLFFGCEDRLVVVGDKDIATCEFNDMIYFIFDLRVKSISAWNEASEEIWVKVEQKRGINWFRVFEANLRRRQDSGHYHTEENVEFGEGDEFCLYIKKLDWKDSKKIWIRLERNSTSGALQVIPADST